MQYEVTEELKSPVRVWSFITLQDFVFLMCWLGFVYISSTLVAKPLKVLYWIFCIIVLILAIMPSTYNPKRRMWQTVFLYFRSDRTIFRQGNGEEDEE